MSLYRRFNRKEREREGEGRDSIYTKINIEIDFVGFIYKARCNIHVNKIYLLIK